MEATQVSTLHASPTVVQSGGGVELGPLPTSNGIVIGDSLAKACKLPANCLQLALFSGIRPFPQLHRLEHEFSPFTGE